MVEEKNKQEKGKEGNNKQNRQPMGRGRAKCKSKAIPLLALCRSAIAGGRKREKKNKKRWKNRPMR